MAKEAKTCTQLLDETTTLRAPKEEAAKFRDERGWKKFHKPKELALSLSIELLEMFQWKSGKETAIKRNKKFHKVGEEFADVVLHCLAMANVLDTHLRCHAEEAEKNRMKYPAKKYYGKAEV